MTNALTTNELAKLYPHLDVSRIDRRPSGNFRVRLQAQGRHARPDLCATIEDAVALRDAMCAELGLGDPPHTTQSIRSWGATWLRTYRAANRDYASDESRFRMHLAKAPFATIPMAAIETPDIVRWLLALTTKQTGHKYGQRPKAPLGWSTRKHILNLLRSMLGDAQSVGIIPSNPALGLRVKKTDADKGDALPEDWPLRPAEQATISGALADDPERFLVAFALGTGLRQGEQWNLRLEDVHVGAREPHVHVRFGSQGKTPKNKLTRKVPLFGVGLDAAKAWLQILPTYAPYNPHGLMFPRPAVPSIDGKRSSKGGSRRQKSKTPRVWSKVRAERKVWWHLLRHTCATALLCGWWGPKWSLAEVGKLLGHTSVRTTEVYAHLLDSELTKLATKTHAAWSRANENESSATRRKPTLSVVPPLSRRKPASTDSPVIPLRATLDSNQWPSAPEADALSS